MNLNITSAVREYSPKLYRDFRNHIMADVNGYRSCNLFRDFHNVDISCYYCCLILQ